MLIERYDEENEVYPTLRGVALIRALLNQSGLKQKELLPIFKTESIVSAVLNGYRKLTVEHIEGLATFFQLPYYLFFETDATTDEQPVFQFEARSSRKTDRPKTTYELPKQSEKNTAITVAETDNSYSNDR